MDKSSKKIERKGAALLVVLFIVMAVTILSVGFLSRSDTEAACGRNMILRTNMDYLAESALEHAKGLILNPQDILSEYWPGGTRQQLIEGSDDYYDVNVVKIGQCNYQITCQAYREKNGERIGQSSLNAELRLDPSIALWIGEDTGIFNSMTINGDVYCNGTLTNNGIVNGDVFANNLIGSAEGQKMPVDDLLLGWPRVTAEDFTSNYSVQNISVGSLQNTSLGSSAQVCHRAGDLILAGGVQVDGMLVVEGDLIIAGNGNIITAEKNLPALLVTGDLVIDDEGNLEINGLAVVNGQMQVSGGAGGISILGGLFVGDNIVETAADSSGNYNNCILYNSPSWQPLGGQSGGALKFDGVDDRLEEPQADNYLNGLSAITVSLWVKSDVIYQDRGILFTRDLTGNDEELGIRYDRNGAFGGGIKCIKASIRTTAGYTQIESTSNVQTTDWQHIALVWQSGSSLKLYINGQLNPLTYDMGAISGITTSISKLTLGLGTKGKYWDGLIDDVRIYNQALDANDVYPPSDGPSGLLGHWKLDEQNNGYITITAAPSKTAIVLWSQGGVAQNWGQTDGAFFRSIERQ